MRGCKIGYLAYYYCHSSEQSFTQLTQPLTSQLRLREVLSQSSSSERSESFAATAINLQPTSSGKQRGYAHGD